MIILRVKCNGSRSATLLIILYFCLICSNLTGQLNRVQGELDRSIRTEREISHQVSSSRTEREMSHQVSSSRTEREMSY